MSDAIFRTVVNFLLKLLPDRKLHILQSRTDIELIIRISEHEEV